MPTPNPGTVDVVCRKTALKEDTVINLFEMGWVYKEEANKAPTWVHPLAQLRDEAFAPLR
jgi:hypothetical protein